MTIAAPLAVLAATIVSIELLRTVGLWRAFGRLSRHGRRSIWLLTRLGVSEWAKERALGLASRRMLMLSLAAAGRLMLVAAPFAAILLIDHWHHFGLARSWTDVPSRIALVVVTSLYIAARRRWPPHERMLEGLALGSRPLVELSFDIERAIYGRRAAAVPLIAPVFVAGFARCGTSVLTRELQRTGVFGSLSYRDLPFPLAPNLWHRLSRDWQRSVAAGERGHGDGLLHDLDSPEAIEEMFWLCHEGDRYRHAGHVAPVAPDAQSCDAFRAHVRLVLLRYGLTRYLSKNNANILRLPALAATFPDAILLHPFRDPLQQAASLHRQHLRACALAADDPYRARFMGWLGHHEFGADHRPIRFGDAAPCRGDPATIDYWLAAWIAAYRFLLAQPDDVRARQCFVDYDRLCDAPDAAAATLGARLGLGSALRLDAMRPPAAYRETGCDAPLADEALAVHAELVGVATRYGRPGDAPRRDGQLVATT